jgi:gliding motility-associated-like protein
MYISHHLTIIFIGLSLFIGTASAQTASFSVNNENLGYCSGDTVIFTNESENFDYVFWDFGDGFDTYTNNPKHIYGEAGLYTIELIAFSRQGSADTAQITIEVHVLPEVSLIPPDDSIYTSAQNYSVQAEGNFDTALWFDGTEQNTITVSKSGYYSLTATSNQTGCSRSKGFWIFFSSSGQAESGISVQNNIITPNNDGINDVLYISNLDELTGCEIQIYNQTGVLLYESKSYKNNWQGHNNSGTPLATGTYYYLIKAQNMPYKTGFVDIIK